MTKVKFHRMGVGTAWYYTDTDFFRYVIKQIEPSNAWLIYRANRGRNFGEHIATAQRLHDAKAWVTGVIQKESLQGA